MPIMKSERDWMKEDDSRTLAQAEVIKADKTRLAGAQEAAKRMLVEEQERNRGLAKVANGTVTRQQSSVGGATIANRSTSKSGVVDLLKGVK